MSIAFEQSETRLNLLRAFAGESQARNRYTFAAGLAKKKNLQVIEGIFTFTANQERAHAKVFYNLLQSVSGENLRIDGTYPVELYPELLQHLRSAQHNEYQEWDHDYKGFAKAAKEEGFEEISHTFSMISEIEKTHGDRFGQFAQLLNGGGLRALETVPLGIGIGHGIAGDLGFGAVIEIKRANANAGRYALALNTDHNKRPFFGVQWDPDWLFYTTKCSRKQNAAACPSAG